MIISSIFTNKLHNFLQEIVMVIPHRKALLKFYKNFRLEECLQYFSFYLNIFKNIHFDILKISSCLIITIFYYK